MAFAIPQWHGLLGIPTKTTVFCGCLAIAVYAIIPNHSSASTKIVASKKRKLVRDKSRASKGSDGKLRSSKVSAKRKRNGASPGINFSDFPIEIRFMIYEYLLPPRFLYVGRNYQCQESTWKQAMLLYGLWKESRDFAQNSKPLKLTRLERPLWPSPYLSTKTDTLVFESSLSSWMGLIRSLRSLSYVENFAILANPKIDLRDDPHDYGLMVATELARCKSIKKLTLVCRHPTLYCKCLTFRSETIKNMLRKEFEELPSKAPAFELMFLAG